MKRTTPSADVSCGPVKTSPRGHVALAVGVDPRAAGDVQRQVGARRLDADLARRREPLDQPRLERRAARPTRRPGRRGPGTARASRSPSKSRVPIPACWAAAGVGHSVIAQRRCSISSRSSPRRARGAGHPRRVDAGERVRVLGGDDPQRGVDLARLGELGRRERVELGVAARGARSASSWPGSAARSSGHASRSGSPAAAPAAAARRASSSCTSTCWPGCTSRQ